MGLLAPLALAALPLLAIILALYLLKLRRPMAPVASLHLWGSLTRDREANSLWQRLRVSALLLLQLLALLILILALARPWVPSSEKIGLHAIIVIDVSASMSAPNDSGRQFTSRLDAAKSKAISIVDNLPQDGTATIIESAEHASVLVPATGDRARLREAVNRLVVQANGTNMTEALKLAGVMSARQSNSAVWVLSDGAFASAVDSVEPIPAEVSFTPFGTRYSNQGLTALSLEQQAGSLHLFVQIANSAAITITRRLDFSIDDASWTARTLTLAPGATHELVIDDVPLGARVVRAELAGQDDLELDDRAWVVNRASAPANVLLVTGGNKFLELSLSLLPTVTLYKIAPGEYKPSEKISGAPVDLTIFDAGITPTLLSELPTGNLLMIAPQSSNSLIAVSGTITDPVPSAATLGSASDSSSPAEQSGRDPLLRYVDLSLMHVAKAAHLEIPKWGRSVLSSDKGPLIVAGEEGNRKIGVLAFDLHDTDLPLQTAFPLLVRNLVTSLLPDPTGGLPANVPPLTAVGIASLETKIDRIAVEDPSAKEWTYPVPTDTERVVFAETSQPGVYYVSQYAGKNLVGQEAFAVNLFSSDESTAPPNPSPGLPAVALPTPSTGEVAGTASQQEQLFKRELWPIVALGGLFVLLVEWAYAQRIAIRRALTERQTRRALERGDRL